MKYTFGAKTNRKFNSRKPNLPLLGFIPVDDSIWHMPKGSYLCAKCCSIYEQHGGKGGKGSKVWIGTIDLSLIHPNDLTPCQVEDLFDKNIACFHHGLLWDRTQVDLHMKKIREQIEREKRLQVEIKIKELEALARKGDLIAYHQWKQITTPPPPFI